MLGFVGIGVSSEQTMSSPDLYGFGIDGQCACHFTQRQHAALSQSVEPGTQGLMFLNACDVACREALSSAWLETAVVERRCNLAEGMGVQQPFDSAHDL
jgi:hypothetical protein